MRIGILFVILVIKCFGSVASFALDTTIKKKFPYALLTPDYGILSEVDLKKNEENALPVPFSESSRAYLYWQCFPTLQFKFLCDETGDFDHDLSLARTIIRIAHGDKYDEYETRRAFSIRLCKNRVEKWKKMSHGETYACIAGKYVGREVGTKNKAASGNGWIYDRFKTKKGCDSYFEDDCK